MNKNPYDVLGIPQSASDDEVKKAYRDLTRKYHPDANVNNPLADLAEEKFKEVQEAYDVIMKEREHGDLVTDTAVMAPRAGTATADIVLPAVLRMWRCRQFIISSTRDVIATRSMC